MQRRTIRPIKQWLQPFASRRLWAFVALLLLGAWIAYKRYPLYLQEPNFYAEDGTVFAKTLNEHGFLAALATPFNGYFIAGIYVLEGAAGLLNTVFGHSNLLNMPTALAVVSYAFWGLLCALPLLLFWHEVRRKYWLVLIGLSVALLPLPAYNYAILGTVGNYKFAFLYIAFLLLVKRLRMAPHSKWVYAIDAGLVLCAFTNATVYLLLPVAFLGYWPGWKSLWQAATWKKWLRTPSFISLLVMYAATVVQLAYVALKGGVDTLEGYLQEPFEIAKAIEIFVQRSLLFPFDHTFTKHLNDLLVIILAIAIGFVVYKVSRRQDRWIALFGVYSALAATALFVSQRSGVSQFFSHYQTSGPDHFFYTQNLIILCAIGLVVAYRADHARRGSARLLAGGFFVVVIGAMLIHNDFSQNSRINRATGDFRYAAAQACQSDTDTAVAVPVYPVSAQSLTVSHTAVCPQVQGYTPARDPILALTPSGATYKTVNEPITQTFKAAHNNLDGISVFLSTFGGAGKSTYDLKLLDASCKRTIRTATFNAKDVIDNAYHDIHFATVGTSKGKTYCFTIAIRHKPDGLPTLALQQSAADRYPQGATTVKGMATTEDVVFDLLYVRQ